MNRLKSYVHRAVSFYEDTHCQAITSPIRHGQALRGGVDVWSAVERDDGELDLDMLLLEGKSEARELKMRMSGQIS